MTYWKAAMAIAALAAAAPTTGDPAAFPHGLARRGCTQEDIPALEVYLTRESFDGKHEPRKPYLHIEMAWGEFSKLVGRDLDLIPLKREESHRALPLVRAELAGAQGSPVWLSGQLRLTRVEVDKAVEGSYRFVAPDKTTVKGEFKARWGGTGRPCG
jgi:hypothetical protein